MSRALLALGDMHAHMVSLGATGINLTIVVDAPAMQDAMGALHAEFFPQDSAA